MKVKELKLALRKRKNFLEKCHTGNLWPNFFRVVTDDISKLNIQLKILSFSDDDKREVTDQYWEHLYFLFNEDIKNNNKNNRNNDNDDSDNDNSDDNQSFSISSY
jgi:hypothetical protein